MAPSAAESSTERRCRQLAQSVEQFRERAAQDPVRGAARLASVEASFQASCAGKSFAPREAAVQVERPDRCEALKQKWLEQKGRIEAAPRHLRGTSPALRDFARDCPDEARAALAADRAQQLGSAAPPAPEPTAAPSGPVTRAKTPGYFVDWDRALTARCDASTPDGRTRCAQLKIDTAVAENRLSQAEVDACRPVTARGSTPREPERAKSQRELQDSRMASLGGDAYWKWSNSAGCQLAEQVQQTFAAVAPPPVVQVLAPGENDLKMCEINKQHPDCKSAIAIPRQSYRHWETRAYAACIQAGAQGKERDHCARSVIDQAIGSKRLSSTAVDECRAEWSRGAKAEIEYLEVYQCLSRRAHVDDARTSVVLQAKPRPSGPVLRKDGYKRPETLAAVHAGDWARVPQRPDDGDYFLNVLGKLEAACPALGLDEVGVKLGQRAAQRVRDAGARIASGQGTVQDLGTMLYVANETLKSMQDCERDIGNDALYESCLSDRDSAFRKPQSRDAREDVGVMVKRHACNGAETQSFARNLSTWLLLPDRKRYVMSWSLGNAKAADYATLFDHCRRQAGGDAAYAWCGCYARKYSLVGAGSRAAPAEVAAAGKTSAFVGDETAWFVPPDLGECAPLREEIDRWREGVLSNNNTTACLLGQGPAPKAVTPDLKACRYRTAWGQIEVQLSQCAPKLFAYQWGDEPVACQ